MGAELGRKLAVRSSEVLPVSPVVKVAQNIGSYFLALQHTRLGKSDINLDYL